MIITSDWPICMYFVTRRYYYHINTKDLFFFRTKISGPKRPKSTKPFGDQSYPYSLLHTHGLDVHPSSIVESETLGIYIVLVTVKKKAKKGHVMLIRYIRFKPLWTK